jgi:hypothetical protein
MAGGGTLRGSPNKNRPTNDSARGSRRRPQPREPPRDDVAIPGVGAVEPALQLALLVTRPHPRAHGEESDDDEEHDRAEEERFAGEEGDQADVHRVADPPVRSGIDHPPGRIERERGPVPARDQDDGRPEPQPAAGERQDEPRGLGTLRQDRSAALEPQRQEREPDDQDAPDRGLVDGRAHSR